MSIRATRPRMGLTFAMAILAVNAIACEDDGLIPSNTTDPPTCEQDERYCGVRGKLDGGPGDSGADAGVVEIDAGFPDGGVGTDTGISRDVGPADTGPVDTGPVDTGVIPSEFLDLSGDHDTNYNFDWSDALLGINGLMGPLQSINASFNGAFQQVLEDEVGLPTAVAFVVAQLAQPVINDLANQITQDAPWFWPLLNTTTNLATFFDNLRVEGGLMSVPVYTIPTTTTATEWPLPSATETWQTLVVQVYARCPPSYTPTQIQMTGCAEQRLNVVALSGNPPPPLGQPRPLEVEIDVEPFAGVLQAGVPAADFEFANRRVGVNVSGLVLIALDLITQAVTGCNDVPQDPDCQQTFAAAVITAVDCPGVAARSGGSLAQQIAIEQACEYIVLDILLQNIVDAIFGVGVSDSNFFEFDQQGRAVDTNGNNRPETLFSAPDPGLIVDGELDVLISADLEGEWWGWGKNP